MRAGFQEALVEAATSDPTIHVLTGDHGYELFDAFRKKFPDRFHNVGVAEANMVGMAAGFARNGLRPIIYGLASFVPNRVFEFIKLQIALDGLPVTMIGDGAGLVYSFLGSSHQTLEDLAVMGSLPGVTTLSPGSDAEMRDALLWAVNQNHSVYVRIGKSGGSYSGSGTPGKPEPRIILSPPGKAQAAVIAHGAMVSQVLKAREMVSELSLDYWSCPTIFPLPNEFLGRLRRDYSKIFVVEEHLLRGGLASELIIGLRNTDVELYPIVAQFLATNQVGDYDWNLKRHGLSPEGITEIIKAEF